MDRWLAMSVLVEVVDRGGFARAARHLGLSPSAATRLVAGLEAHLDVRLLHRTTRSVTPTDAGARYVARARRILAELDDAERAARAERREPQGRLAIAAPRVFGRRHVAPVVHALLAQHPRLTAALELSDRFVNLVEEGLDVAVRIGELPDSALRARVVGHTRRVLVASPAYLHGRDPIRTPEDLRSHAQLQFSGLGDAPIWRFGDARVDLTPAFASNDVDAVLSVALAGGGVARALSYQVHDDVRAGRLCVILAEHEPAPLPIQLVFPAARLRSAALEAFVRLVVETCAWDFTDLGADDPGRGALAVK